MSLLKGPEKEGKKYTFNLLVPWYYRKQDGRFGRIRQLTLPDFPEHYIKEGIVYVSLQQTDLKDIFVPIKETIIEFYKIIEEE